MLRGRTPECAALDALLAQAQAGESRVLVLRGEPGIGKTALLDYVAERAGGCRVVRTTGVESEMQLSYAGLHHLCGPFLDRVQELARPQATALATVFGLDTGGAPNAFLVGVAVLSLLADVAEHEPLVCLVDDAQWLDPPSAQVLGFVGRRLLAEPIALVCAARTGGGDDALAGFPELSIAGLGDSDARALLSESAHGPLDDALCERLVAECRGNPLALLELPRTWWKNVDRPLGLGPDERAPGIDKIEESYAERFRSLPHQTQMLVLTAAAEPRGDPDLLRRAAQALGIDLTAIDPAQDAGLLRVGARVQFAHPLVRSAVYRSAATGDRRRVHQALADATDPATDPDRQAWHRAQATPGPDDDIADALEGSASRAQTTGGLAAAAAFLERAAQLTVDPHRRTQRTLAAAEAKREAGAPEPALTLIAGLGPGALDERQRARVALLRGRIAVGSPRLREAPRLLLDAAIQLEPLEPALARDTYLDALLAALWVGRLADDVDVTDVAAAALRTTARGERPEDRLLDGLASVITDGYATGAVRLRQAIARCRHEETLRWGFHAAHAARDVWDDENWERLCAGYIDLARRAGALALLPVALSSLASVRLFAGDLVSAAALVEETASLNAVTGSGFPPYGELALAAWRGREQEATTLMRAVRSELEARGEGRGLTFVEHAAAVLYNGLGQYEEACAAAERGAAYPPELGFANWSLVQLVEAASRNDQHTRARDALARLAETTGPSGTDWALGVEARSRALVSEGAVAETLYREAISHLARTRLHMERARAHLVYGEWLRRGDRRVDAREQLRAAHEMFVMMGTEAFAERARRELIATGEQVRSRGPELRDQLTPQEEQIARLACDGLSNREIGAQLFLSARTVEWHLTHVFGKLHINSRSQLHTALSKVHQHVARSRSGRQDVSSPQRPRAQRRSRP
jgi:DNA-binding CsgD family transcriptional regulator/tetratricopeptide (TPR) repeat protein